MGTAARLNPRANGTVQPTDGPRNPSAVLLRQRHVRQSDFNDAQRRKAVMRVAFTDRAYVIDATGTFRRAPFVHINRER